MSFSNTAETELLDLIFNAGGWANVADNAASAPLTNLYVALHTANPAEDASGAEAAYTSYARVAVARTAGGWTVSGASASNTAAINFPACTGGSATATHFAIWTASSAGTMIAYGALSSSLAISNGITPSFASGQLTFTLD